MKVESKVIVTMSYNDALELISELAEGLANNQTNPIVVGDLQIWINQHDRECVQESSECECEGGNCGSNMHNPFWRAAR